MLTQKELESSIMSTENSIKYYKWTLIETIKTYRAMKRDLKNYRRHLEHLTTNQLSMVGKQ